MSGDAGADHPRLGIKPDRAGRSRFAAMSPAWLAVAVCTIGLLAGWGIKGRCLAPWEDYRQYEELCYNDVQPLWGIRGVGDRTFPYVSGELVDGNLSGGAIEYPVLTGVFMWASGAWAGNPDEYLVHSVLLLAPFGLATAYMLGRAAGTRALMWSAAPALALYAFHNWDLLVVAAAVAGLWCAMRDRPLWAALWFGVGGALKLYPLLFLMPLAARELMARRPRNAAAAVGVGGGVFAAVNLPFVLAGFEGWWATFEFHRLRGPNFDNIWAVREFGPLSLPYLDPPSLNLVTAALTALFIAAALAYGLMRARRTGDFPMIPVAAALLVAFLLWNKVHSPQYALWLLPFFVLCRVSVWWWAAYAVVDAAVYVGVFRFFFEACSTNSCAAFSEPTVAQQVMNAGVFARAGLLLALFVVFLRAGSARPPPDDPVASHPLAKVKKQRAAAPAQG